MGATTACLAPAAHNVVAKVIILGASAFIVTMAIIITVIGIVKAKKARADIGK